MSHIAAALILAGLWCYSRFRPPRNWSVDNLDWWDGIAAVVALLCSLLVSGGVVSVAVLVYVYITSCITDIEVHRYDRWVLRIAILTCVCANVSLVPGEYMWLWIAMMAVCGIFVGMPKVMGSSDARALMLCVAAGVPLYGPEMFVYGLAASCLLALAWMAIKAMRERHFSWHDRIPMIPFLVLPHISLALYYCV